MIHLLRQIQASVWFQRLVLGAILGAGVLVGLETDRSILERHGALLRVLDHVVLGIFVCEIAVKLGARWPRPWLFFRDPWNVFDFAIVAFCLLPGGTSFAPVLRLLRILRVLRLVTALPRLQILVGALLKSLPSMGYVAILLLLHFYVYSVIGVSLFSPRDAEHFGNLGSAMLTLFQIVTLEGWADIMRGLLAQPSPPSLVTVGYFVSFILLGTMIILNLLIGVIMSGMQEAQAEAESEERARQRARSGQSEPTLQDELTLARRHLDELGAQLERVRRQAAAVTPGRRGRATEDCAPTQPR